MPIFCVSFDSLVKSQYFGWKQLPKTIEHKLQILAVQVNVENYKRPNVLMNTFPSIENYQDLRKCLHLLAKILNFELSISQNRDTLRLGAM